MVEVEVEFDYDAELKDELTIRTGEIITQVKQMDGGWWEGTNKNGKRGLFPDNFVKVISSSSGSTVKKKESVVLRKGENKRKHCKVLFSYQPSHEDELELNINQIIEYTEEVEDGWWKGVTQDGKTGVFPSNFVQVINSKNDDSVVTTPKTTTSATPNSTDSEITPIKSVVADKNKRNKEKIGIPPPPPAAAAASTKMTTTTTTTSSNSGTLGKISANNITSSKLPPHAEKKIATALNNTSSSSSISNDENNKKIKSSSESLNNAPKLPPKPVKETCKVIFPYTALNDDELHLDEGQIVTIISKEVEDKGWWKGEIDGKVGVFPDNFVKLIVNDEINNTSKKHSNNKGTPFKRDNSLDSNTTTSSKLRNKTSTSNTNLKSSFGKSNPPPSTPTIKSSSSDIKKTESLSKLGGGSGVSARSSSSSPLKSSFGKSGVKSSSSMSSTESLKSTSSFLKNKETNNTNSLKSLKSKEKESKAVPPAATVTVVKSVRESSVSPSPPKEFDSVIRRESLNHPTADRVKGPKRRPPSSVFLKDSTKSPDSSINTSKDSSTENLSSLPPQSRSSKIVQNIKGVLGGLTNGSDRKSAPPIVADTKADVKSFEVKKEEKRASSLSSGGGNDFISPSSPIKTLSRSSLHNAAQEEDASISKKPEWLEELSRKQAHRKSGLFQEKSSSNDNNKPTSPTSSTPSSNVNHSINNKKENTINKPEVKPEKPSIIGDKPLINNESKPYIPTKPSQIKDEVRKFNKRPTSIESLGGGGSDKENNKPTTINTTILRDASMTSPKENSNNILEGKPPKAVPVISSPKSSVLPTPPDPSSKPTIIKPSTPSSPQNIDEKSFKQSTILKLDIDPENDDLSLLERVRRLEKSLLNVHSYYGQQINELKTCLEQERNDKLKLQNEIQALKNKH